MAIRLQGRFEITSSSLPTPLSGRRAIVQGRFVDPSGRSFATDVTVGMHVFAGSPVGGVFRWRIETVNSSTATDLDLQLIFDQPVSEYPVAANEVPILIGDGVITAPREAGGPAYIPSHTATGITEGFTATANSINDFAVVGAAGQNLNSLGSQIVVSNANLFDAADEDVQVGSSGNGFFIDESDGTVETTTSVNGPSVTGFIPVSGGTTYAVSTKHQMAWYDSNRAFVSGIASQDHDRSNDAIVAPSNAAFVRLTMSTVHTPDNFMIVEGPTLPSTYRAFGEVSENVFRALINGIRVHGEAIIDNSLSVGQLNFAETASSNLYDANDPDVFTGSDEAGRFINAGVPQNLDTYFSHTGFIPVKENTKYTISNKRWTSWFDAARNYIGQSPNNDGRNPDGSATLLSPPGAAFMRTSCSDAEAFEVFVVVRGSILPDVYAPKADPVVETIRFLGDLKIGGQNLQDRSIGVEKTSFFQLSLDNLVNPNDPDAFAGSGSTGRFVNAANGQVVDHATVPWSVTGFIPVEGGRTYTVSHKRHTAWFDEDRNYISGNSSTSQPTLVAPDNAAFGRWSTHDPEQWAVFMVREGTSVPATFSPFGYKFLPGAILNRGGEASPSSSTGKWTGIRWYSMGDSITAANGWQPLVVEALGLLSTNGGDGGTTLALRPDGGNAATAMSQPTRINLIPDNSQLVTVFAGANDYRQDLPLGEQGSTDPMTFWGALQECRDRISARVPDAKIVFMSPMFRDGSPFFGGQQVNNVGHVIEDYADAVIRFCNEEELDCVNLMYGTGHDLSTNLLYTTDRVHPNLQGNQMIARELVAVLNLLSPSV